MTDYVPEDFPTLWNAAPIPDTDGGMSYEGPVGWEDFPPEPGERPRVIIAGWQRPIGSAAPLAPFRRLMQFHDARVALNRAGYSGVSVRLAPNSALGPTTDLTRWEDIPWRTIVERDMPHCVGVALLDGDSREGSGPAVAWECDLADRLGLRVRPLAEWIADPFVGGNPPRAQPIAPFRQIQTGDNGTLRD